LSFSDSQIDSADAIIDPAALGGSVPPPVPSQPTGTPSPAATPPPIRRTTKPSGAKPNAPQPSPARPLPPPPPPPYTPPAVRPPSTSGVSPQTLGNGRPGSPAIGNFIGGGGVGSNLVGNADSAALARARASGVGSARGIAWRDELPVGNDEETREEDELDLQREAPAWLISLVVHLVLLLVLALIYTPVGQRMTTIVLEVGNAPDQGDELESFELDMAAPEVSEAMEMNVVEPALEPVEMPRELLTNDSLIELPVIPQTNITSIEIPTSGMMSGRSGATKEALLAAYGGTQETEDAVQAGLRWLVRQQQKDGSWSLEGPYSDGGLTDNKTAATAMAMLAFQGNGNTHMSGPYQKAVQRGLDWLLKQQDRKGLMSGSSPRHEKHYAQAQASIVVCELYAMTKDSRLREPAQRAVRYAEAAQHSGGGWRYEIGEEGDTSVTGWFVMVLQSARAAGLDVNDSKLRRVSDYLNSVQHVGGAAYSYQRSGGPSKAMTAEGILCRQYLGWSRDMEPMAVGINALVDQGGFDVNERDFYFWYYATQVIHHYGGSPWREWNSKMRVELPRIQVTAGAENGSWAPQRSVWGGRGGRLYTTCLAIYCLEVYYRHLPLYESPIE
jgi:hypothetical protein